MGKLLNIVFKIVLSVQLVWCRVSFAGTDILYSQKDRMDFLYSIKSWKIAMSIISLQTGRDDVLSVARHLKKSGVDLNDKIPLNQKNGEIFFNGEKIGITTYGIQYKGIVLKYNFSKSYKQNFDIFLEKISKKNDSYSKISIFMNKAYADIVGIPKADISKLSIKFSYAAAALTTVAFLVSAPEWLVLGSALATAVYASVGLVYRDEELGVPEIYDFTCLENGKGFSFKTKEDSVIKTTRVQPGTIFVETLTKSGTSLSKRATKYQTDLFSIITKACNANNSQVVKDLRENLATKKTSQDTGVKSKTSNSSSATGVQ